MVFEHQFGRQMLFMQNYCNMCHGNFPTVTSPSELGMLSADTLGWIKWTMNCLLGDYFPCIIPSELPTNTIIALGPSWV